MYRRLIELKTKIYAGLSSAGVYDGTGETS